MNARPAIAGLWVGLPVSLLLWAMLLLPAHREIHHGLHDVERTALGAIKSERR